MSQARSGLADKKRRRRRARNRRRQQLAGLWGARCPYCHSYARTLLQEMEHMDQAHPDVVEARLKEAGFERRGGRLVDTWATVD